MHWLWQRLLSPSDGGSISIKPSHLTPVSRAQGLLSQRITHCRGSRRVRNHIQCRIRDELGPSPMVCPPWTSSAASLTVLGRLYPPEIMPLAFRAKGVSISTATVRLLYLFDVYGSRTQPLELALREAAHASTHQPLIPMQNFWVGWSTPLFQQLIGWRLYPMHAFFCTLSFVIGEHPVRLLIQADGATSVVYFRETWSSASATKLTESCSISGDKRSSTRGDGQVGTTSLHNIS